MTHTTRRLGRARRPRRRRAADGRGAADGAAGRRAQDRHGLHTRHLVGTTHTFNLVADTGHIQTPDGNSIFMWSYADADANRRRCDFQ